MPPQQPPSNEPPRRTAGRDNAGRSARDNEAAKNPQPYQPLGSGQNRPPSSDPRRPTPGPNQPGRSANSRSNPPENGPGAVPPPLPGQFFSPDNARPNRRGQRRPRPVVREVAPAQPRPRSVARQVVPPLPGSRSAPAVAPALPRSRPPRRWPWKPILGYGLLVALVVGGLIGLFVATRLFGFLNNISVARQDVNGQVISGSSVTGHGRLNLLLLGVDRRPDNNDGARSDTMILVSLDQDNKSVNVLSVPRDLWVKIPGHGNNRVNAAYFFGDQERPNQGGPPLAKQTVLDNFGIKVDYFMEIDFNGFRSIIDALGGITLDVKKPLIDSEYPTEDYGIKRVYIPAGIQRMNGQVALEYARSRHSDSDLGRNQRQQEVLLAVREQGINLGLLTNSQLQAALVGALKTDLQPGDILALGQTAVGIKRDAIKQFSIDANIAHNATIDGNDVLQADPAALSQLLKDFQSTSNTRAGPAVKETARISVLNGTFQAGRAAITQKFLEAKGYPVASIDQAQDAGSYPQTVINVYNGKQQTANELASLLSVSPDRVRVKSSGPPGVDLEVICGDDLKLPG